MYELKNRKSPNTHYSLILFLCIEDKVYREGLVLKKLEKLIKQSQENEYLKSIGLHKKLRGTDAEKKKSKENEGKNEEDKIEDG